MIRSNKRTLFRIVAYLIGIAAVTGCSTIFQPKKEDPVLRQYAVAANIYIGQHFGTLLSDSKLSSIHLIWGTRSEYIPGCAKRISILRDLKSDPIGAQWHMYHEMFHAVSELSDNPTRYKDGKVPQYFNGIHIADWVAWGQ